MTRMKWRQLPAFGLTIPLHRLLFGCVQLNRNSKRSADKILLLLGRCHNVPVRLRMSEGE